jgi:hypothetical protein
VIHGACHRRQSVVVEADEYPLVGAEAVGAIWAHLPPCLFALVVKAAAAALRSAAVARSASRWAMSSASRIAFMSLTETIMSVTPKKAICCFHTFNI